MLPTLHDSVDELLVGLYKQTPLSSDNIYNVYNNNLDGEQPEYKDGAEFELDYCDRCNHYEYLPSMDEIETSDDELPSGGDEHL